MNLFLGGWCNNPSAAHFKNIFRKIISRCGALTTNTGNCLNLDDLTLVQNATSTYIPPVQDAEEVVEVFVDAPFLVPQPEQEVLENILVYISGWVVRKLLPRVTCEICKEALLLQPGISRYATSYFFLELKTNGGLVKPSEGVVSVVVAAERHLRQISSITKLPKKSQQKHLEVRVLSELGNLDIFYMGDHVLESQEGIDNHHLSLIRSIIQHFCTLRHHYTSRLHNIKIHESVKRNKLTRDIIFLGQ